MRDWCDTAVGIAHSAFAERLIESSSGLVDYVEIPFEQLVHNPASADLRHKVPLLLHCASLSLAGNAPPSESIVSEVSKWARLFDTPWIGEHLAFVSAKAVQPGASGGDVAYLDLQDGKPLNVGYTVSPQYSNEVLERVIESVALYKKLIDFPIIIENGPMYFEMPGSKMKQSDFIRLLCDTCPGVHLLLDLSHLAITCHHYREDPIKSLLALPLDRVVEVHLSGIYREDDAHWDDHSIRTPEIVFEMCAMLLECHRPRAITLEYNWNAHFPTDILTEDVGRVRRMLGQADAS